jgi:hypothetical protein
MLLAVQHAREVKARLLNPTNAVVDRGIDLKRKEIQAAPVEEPKPTLVPAVFVLPYAIGTLRPNYTLSYEVPYRRPEGALSIRMIQRAVCLKYGISLGDMLSERRTWNIVRPRQIAMYLAKELTGKSLPELGRRFGDRDHTTILHGIRKIQALRESDEQVNAIVVELSNLLVASPCQTEDAPCISPPITAA